MNSKQNEEDYYIKVMNQAPPFIKKGKSYHVFRFCVHDGVIFMHMKLQDYFRW